MKMIPGRRALATVGTAAVLAGAGVLAVGTPAFAAIGEGRVQLCAQGNYAAQIKWSASFGYSFVVAQGTCQTFTIPVGSGGYVIGGIYNVSHDFFDIKAVPSPRGGFSSSTPGAKYGAEGTTTSPNVVQWQ